MPLRVGQCPWCGSPGSIIGGAATKHRGAQWRCDHCDARGPVQNTERGGDLLPSEAASDAFWSAIKFEAQPTP